MESISCEPRQAAGRFSPETTDPRPIVFVTEVGGADGSRGAAAALACAGARVDRAALLVDLGGSRPRPTLLSTTAATGLEERLARAHPGLASAARGQLCQAAVSADAQGLSATEQALAAVRPALAIIHMPPWLALRALVERPGLRPTGVLLRADLAAERPLLGFLASDLRLRGIGVGVLKRRLGWVAERRALFGALPPDAPEGLPRWLVRRLLSAAAQEDGVRPEAPATVGEGIVASEAARDRERSEWREDLAGKLEAAGWPEVAEDVRHGLGRETVLGRLHHLGQADSEAARILAEAPREP